MSPARRKRLYHFVSWGWWICAIFLLINVVSISANYNLIKRQIKRNSGVIQSFPVRPTELEGLAVPQPTSSEFTVITPSNRDNGNHRRVVRKRRKKVRTTRMPSVVTSVAMLTNSEEKEQLPTHVASHRHRPHYRKRGHSNNVAEVWKVQNFNLDDHMITSDLKPSVLDKRGSSERRNNYTSLLNSQENSRDLHSDESSNPFLNSSTPISNELQNSLQFTLQILHPLLNSDTDFSDQHKIPENKTVAVTHSLSESVAQTPVAPDLGFLPTHLKKKHPLLDQGAFFAGDSGASKTGVRTNYDIQPYYTKTTTSSPKTPTLDTSLFSTSHASSPSTTTSKTTTARATAKSTTISTTRSTTTLRAPSTTTAKVTSTTPSTTTSKVPSTSISTTTTTTTTTTKVPTVSTSTKATTTPVTTSTQKSTTKLTPTSISSTTTKRPTTTESLELETPFSLDHILGILNITELTEGKIENSSESTGTNYNQANSNNEETLPRPPLITSQSEEATTTKPPTTTAKFSTSSQTSSPVIPIRDTSSAEVSSVEQLLLEQLLGIGNRGGSQNGKGDSEQLLNLLVQGQLEKQNEGKPTTPNIPNQVLGSGNSQYNNDQTNVLLQNLILSSLQSQNQNPNVQNQQELASTLLNWENFLASTQATLTTKKPNQPKTSFQLPTSLKTQNGLSDADLKSIFELLDSKPSEPPSATSTTTTTTTPKPTPRLTTAPPATTTTLHPALQSMLDMFTNQLKPFQSIPSSASTFLADVAKPVTKPPPPITTTNPPTSFASTTLNSIDFLSQLLNLGGGGLNKVNPVRSTPLPEFSLSSIFGGQRTPQPPIGDTSKAVHNQDFSLASIFGKNSNLFHTNFPSLTPSPTVPAPVLHHEPSAPAETNQLLNFFGSHTTTPPPPNGLYYWMDLNAFLGGDPKADGMAGIRPKMGNKFPFIKITR